LRQFIVSKQGFYKTVLLNTDREVNREKISRLFRGTGPLRFIILGMEGPYTSASSRPTSFVYRSQQPKPTALMPRPHSYCLALPLCLQWYNGFTTPWEVWCTQVWSNEQQFRRTWMVMWPVRRAIQHMIILGQAKTSNWVSDLISQILINSVSSFLFCCH